MWLSGREPTFVVVMFAVRSQRPQSLGHTFRLKTINNDVFDTQRMFYVQCH